VAANTLKLRLVFQAEIVAEIRYPYACRESGAICQPDYHGPRDDIPQVDCTTGQLICKQEPH
jgi:hypothetical protein